MARYLLFQANNPQWLDANFQGLNGGKMYVYDAGTTTPITTYELSVGGTTNTNPIQLDASGRPPAEVWVDGGTVARIVMKTSADVLIPGADFDYLPGINDPVSSGTSNLQWIESGLTPTYISSTQFTVTGNQTTLFEKGTRVQYICSGGTLYGTVTSSSYSGVTTVNIDPDGAGLDSGLTDISTGIITVDNTSLDAAAVHYTDTITYTGDNVGTQIQALYLEPKKYTLLTTTTSSGAGPVYVATPTAVVTSYSTTSSWMIKFDTATTGSGDTPTLNISGVGAANLKTLDSSGSKIKAVLTAGLVSQVVYDGTDFIVLDLLPAGSTSVTPGCQVFDSVGSNTFTVPASVTSVTVMCIGGGGGGGAGSSTGGESPTNTTGGTGGFGGIAIKTLSVTAGDMITVVIGAGGAGSLYGAGLNGAAGGSTTFGATLAVATGGSGGIDSTPVNGSNGYDAVSDYGFDGIAGSKAGTLKGKGGIGGTGPFVNGTSGYNGLCTVTYYK